MNAREQDAAAEVRGEAVQDLPRSEKFTIPTFAGPMKIEGYAVTEHFIVHREVSGRDFWTVTHVRSGLGMVNIFDHIWEYPRTFDQAKRIAEKLEPLCDWSKIRRIKMKPSKSLKAIVGLALAAVREVLCK